LCALLVAPLTVLGQDVIVTRSFTGVWDQVEHESQGINLQIIDQLDGSKVGVVYWFTYGEDRRSAWFLGVGEATGNRIDLVLYEGEDIGFLEDDTPGDDPRINEVGTMEMVFTSCIDADVTFSTTIAGVDSGTFTARRFTDLYNTTCSGGISDDTPSSVLPTEQRIGLAPARDGVTGSGHADFEERPDRTEFSVEAEDIPDGSYRIVVGGIDRGELVVSLGADNRTRGETEFRSPVEAGKVLLTFDPRDQVIEIHDAIGAVLTSGDTSIGGGGDDGGGTEIDWGTVEIEVELINPGVYPLASGRARLEPRDDRTDFSVEIEDVPEGSYAVSVGGEMVGNIQVVTLQDGSVEGDLEFRNPVEPGKVLLDFDPRGQQIDVLEGQTVIMEVLFPES
jgi:hypothetical protein